MTRKIALCACVAALFAGPTLAATHAKAADEAAAPILCKDGTTSEAQRMRGACSGHGGVDKKATTNAAAARQSETVDASKDTRRLGAAGSKVWVNESTKVYHCQGDRWYGKTKKGEYMSEAEARSKGFRADHDKACGS